MGSTLQTASQLPAPRRGTPPCHSTLPVLTSPNTVHFPSRGGRGNPSPAPTPPPANASLPGTRCRARCTPSGRRTIPRRGAHNHSPPGLAARTPGMGCAPRPRALRARHTSRAPRGPHSAAFIAPPHSGAHSPAPRPSPLLPGRSRSPAPPSSAPAKEAPPAPPSPEPPPAPAPLTAAQRPAAAAGEGGRRPGPRKRPDRRDPGRTPYLGGRRGGDGRSGSASERGGRR